MIIALLSPHLNFYGRIFTYYVQMIKKMHVENEILSKTRRTTERRGIQFQFNELNII